MVQEMDTSKEYFIEIYAFTDSDNVYNFKLSEERGKEVEDFIRNSFSGSLNQIDVFAKGENDPKYSNDIDQKKKLNRRVEVQLFETKNGKLVFRAKEGTELEVGRNYFGDCPICESRPEIQEASSNAKAEAMGGSLVTNDGMDLQTGGMMKMTHSCFCRRL